MLELPPEITEEERLLETVRANLARLEAKEARPDYERTLVELRDSLEGEKLDEDIASVMEAMQRTAALLAQQARSEEGQVNIEDPYFGHLVVNDEMGRRSVLLGRETFLSDRVRIVDWRNAPISRIFYQFAEGDEYDVPIAGRIVSGEVEVRRTLAIADGRLRRVATDDHIWVRDADDRWIDWREKEARDPRAAWSSFRVAPEAARRRSAFIESPIFTTRPPADSAPTKSWSWCTRRPCLPISSRSCPPWGSRECRSHSTTAGRAR
jgi:hypothetical protein